MTHLLIQAEKNTNLYKYTIGNTKCLVLGAKQSEIWEFLWISVILIPIIEAYLASMWLLAVFICSIFLYPKDARFTSLKTSLLLPNYIILQTQARSFPMARSVSHFILSFSVSHCKHYTTNTWD